MYDIGQIFEVKLEKMPPFGFKRVHEFPSNGFVEVLDTLEWN